MVSRIASFSASWMTLKVDMQTNTKGCHGAPHLAVTWNTTVEGLLHFNFLNYDLYHTAGFVLSSFHFASQISETEARVPRKKASRCIVLREPIDT
jgi:hypothetical protein